VKLQLRGWIRMGAPVALVGGLLWLLAEADVGLPALLRSAAWGLVVWVGCGVIWLGLEYGQEHEDARDRRSQMVGGERSIPETHLLQGSEAAGRDPLRAAGGAGSGRVHAGHAGLR
jgi:hypothetical protein